MNSFEDFLKLPCRVINLERNPERWVLCEERLKEAGFTNYQRVVGVDGKNKEQLKEEWEKLNNPKFAEWDKEFVSYPGKQGCFLSHFKIWKEVLEHKIPYIIILEDDVLFHPQWKDLTPAYLEGTPKDFDVVYMGSQIEFNSQYHVDRGPVFCTHAMVLSYAGVEKLYNLLLNNPTGVYTIDCMLIDLMKQYYRKLSMNRDAPLPFHWYVWNGQRFYPTNLRNMPKGWTKRNGGIIFQDESFGSEVRIW
jgi:hypothetical protein